MPATVLNLLDEALLLLSSPPTPSWGFPPDPLPGRMPGHIYVGRGNPKGRTGNSVIRSYTPQYPLRGIDNNGYALAGPLWGNSENLHYYLPKNSPHELFQALLNTMPS